MTRHEPTPGNSIFLPIGCFEGANQMHIVSLITCAAYTVGLVPCETSASAEDRSEYEFPIACDIPTQRRTDYGPGPATREPDRPLKTIRMVGCCDLMRAIDHPDVGQQKRRSQSIAHGRDAGCARITISLGEPVERWFGRQSSQNVLVDDSQVRPKPTPTVAAAAAS